MENSRILTFGLVLLHIIHMHFEEILRKDREAIMKAIPVVTPAPKN